MTLRVAGVRFGGGAGRLRWGSGAAAVAAAYDPGVVALPLFPLGTVLLPGGDLPLTLFEPRYLELLRRLLDQPAADRVFGVIALRRGNEVGPNAALDLHDIGCAARITHVERAFPASRGIAIETAGTRRFRLHRLDADAGTPFHTGEVEWLDEPEGEDPLRWAERVRRDVTAYRSRLRVRPLTVPDEPLSLSYAAADAIVLAADERQQVLAATTVTARLRLVAGLVRRELTLLDHLPSLPDTTQHRTPSPN